MNVLFVLLALLPAINAEFKRCKKLYFKPWRHWVLFVQKGERNFLTHISEDAGNSGKTYKSICFTKGDRLEDEMLSSSVTTTFQATGAIVSQNSTMPCKGLREAFDLKPWMPYHWTEEGKKELKDAEKSKLRRLDTHTADTTSTSCDPGFMEPGFSPKCEYPTEEQTSWGVVSYQIKSVNPGSNGVGKTSVSDGATLGTNVTERQVYGSNLSEPCEVWTEYGGYRNYWPSGLLQIAEPIPEFKVYAYRFVSDAERDLAMQDDRNVGLKYAQNLKGANGCDTEIVYAMKAKPRQSGTCLQYWNATQRNAGIPCSGGGVYVEMSTTYEALGKPIADFESKYKSGIRAYQVLENNTVVVQQLKSINRERAYLPVRTGGCDDGYEEVMRFANNFVCKSSGNRYPARVMMSVVPQPNRGITKFEEVSKNTSAPTYFNPINYDVSTLNYGLDFTLVLDNVPEDCGEFFWEPVLASTVGNGKSVSAGGIWAMPSLVPGVSSPWDVILLIVVFIMLMCFVCIGSIIMFDIELVFTREVHPEEQKY